MAKPGLSALQPRPRGIMSLPVLPGDSTPSQTDTHQLSNRVDESPLEEMVAQLTAASPTSRRLASPPGTDRTVSTVHSRTFSFISLGPEPVGASEESRD